MYHYTRFQAQSEVEESYLAKTSLLVSLWAPPKLEIAMVSLWVDRALYHTRQYLEKYDPITTTPVPIGQDILYWCCIVRNSLISYVMRRPYRLHVDGIPLCDPEDIRREFELEARHHNFCTSEAKLQMIDDFILLCKVTSCLYSILKSHQSLLFEVQWNAERPIDRTSEVESDAPTGQLVHEYILRYVEAAKYESELEDLIKDHEERRIFKNLTKTIGGEEEIDIIARMRSYNLYLITQ